MSPFEASTLITAATSFVISFSVILAGGKLRINQAWSLTTFLLGTWSLGLYGVITAGSAATAMRWQYLLDASAILIPLGFFAFTVYLVRKEQVLRWPLRLTWLVAICLFAVTFSPAFKVGMAQKFSFNYWIVAGPIYWVFPLTYLIFALVSLFLLLNAYRQTADGQLRGQITYVLGAQIIGFGGGITNFLPQLMNIYPIGNYFIAFYGFFITYSILRNGLFSMKLLATEFFIFSIWIFTLARTLLAAEFLDKVLNGVLFLVLLFFGILLVRSVRREVRAREELEVLYKKVDELSHFKSQLLSLASHQMRSPLAAIKGFVQLMEQGMYGPIAEKPRETIGKIRKEAEDLLDLINTLLDLRRVEEGRMEYSFSRTDISAITSEVVEGIRPLAAQKHLDLIFVSPGPAYVNADEKISQVVRNLIDNAIKYTPVGHVRVEVNTGPDWVKVEVSDTGLGIDPELRPHLFEEYSRDEKVKKKILGTGLGLYIAKKIVEAHGGKLSAESEGPGKGSDFILVLPLLQQAQLSVPQPSPVR